MFVRDKKRDQKFYENDKIFFLKNKIKSKFTIYRGIKILFNYKEKLMPYLLDKIKYLMSP